MPRQPAKSSRAAPAAGAPPRLHASSPRSSQAADPATGPAEAQCKQAPPSAPLGVRLGVQRIVSGGQTGVDRGALDAALSLKIDHGGWCPRGRLAEDGRIPAHYQLCETEESEYAVRTERNVIDSSGTLLLFKQRLQRGTLLTYRLAQKHGRPALRVRLDEPVEVAAIQTWLLEHAILVLNVAGPRASSFPGIEVETRQLLERIFTEPRPSTQLGLFK